MCTDVSYQTQLFPPFTFSCKQAQSSRSPPRSHTPVCQPMLSSSPPVTGAVIPIHFYLMPYSSQLHSPPHTLHTLLLTLAQPCGLYGPPGSFSSHSFSSHSFISLVISPPAHLFHSLLLFRSASTYHRDINTFVNVCCNRKSLLFVCGCSPPPTVFPLLAIPCPNCFPCNLLPVLSLCFSYSPVKKHSQFC